MWAGTRGKMYVCVYKYTYTHTYTNAYINGVPTRIYKYIINIYTHVLYKHIFCF